MKLIATFPFADFTLYMLNYETEANKHLNWSAREGVLELCHNHGVENDSNYKLNNGNGEKDRGLVISVCQLITLKHFKINC